MSSPLRKASPWMAPRPAATTLVLRDGADGLEVRNSRFPDCLFGIYVQQSDRAQIVGNEVHGRPTLREVDRGNGIHLFDASHVVVEGNVIDGTRDGLYISATDDSRIIGNRIHHVRYAVHYMWSHRNHLEDNEATDSLAGFALMQSHDLVVVGNRMARNRRAGLLARHHPCVIEWRLPCGRRPRTITFSTSTLFFIPARCSTIRAMWSPILRSVFQRSGPSLLPGLPMRPLSYPAPRYAHPTG